MEKVEIRFRATALNNKSDHALHGVTLHVVKSGNNFEIVGLEKE